MIVIMLRYIRSNSLNSPRFQLLIFVTLLIILLGFYVGMNSQVLAQGQGYVGFTVVCNDPGQTYIATFDTCLDFGTALSSTVTYAMILGILLTGAKVIIGAISYIMAAGDPVKLENARDTITDAFLGLVLLASAWILLTYVNDTFPEEWGIDFFNFAPPVATP